MTVIVGVEVGVFDTCDVGEGNGVAVDVVPGGGVPVRVGVCVGVGVAVDGAVDVAVGVGVAVAVAVAVDVALPKAFAACTAASPFPTPAPQSRMVHVLLAGKPEAVLRNKVNICAAVSDGLTDSMSEMMPATCGAAMLVPP